jgi:thioredoxin-like negative regulator of GroEL
LPVIESLAGEFAGRARFVTVHVDRDSETLEQFDSSGLPTYLVFRDGQPVDRLLFSQIGWFLERRLRRMVNGALD